MKSKYTEKKKKRFIDIDEEIEKNEGIILESLKLAFPSDQSIVPVEVKETDERYTTKVLCKNGTNFYVSVSKNNTKPLISEITFTAQEYFNRFI